MLLAAHAGTRRALCTLAGTWEQMRTEILRALGEMMLGPWVATRLGTLLIRAPAQGGNRRLYAWTAPAADRPWVDLGSTLGRPPVALATYNFP